ncbi:hypothetical protein [Polaribacter sp. L3A8]|uniref:hypothetical protein n=1 Tax=Polaribacter sp. L3A8 TaxID=2686361 RepID=UPI00131B421F|nr:hypothetical protein [Polaribacter sp. L3A8]
MKKLKIITTLFFCIILLNNCQQDDVTPEEVDSISLAINKLREDNIMVFNSTKGNGLIVAERDGFEDGFASGAPGDIICQGSGISFARCVRKQLDKGTVLKVYKKGDMYYAEEMEKSVIYDSKTYNEDDEGDEYNAGGGEEPEE